MASYQVRDTSAVRKCDPVQITAALVDTSASTVRDLQRAAAYDGPRSGGPVDVFFGNERWK